MSRQYLNPVLMLCFTLSYIAACSVDDDPNTVACTDIFTIHTLTVLDPDGNPADSVQISVRNSEHGESYNLCHEIYCETSISKGEYVIFHDGFLGEISTESEEVTVEGQRGTLVFSEEFSFYDDGCHIQKLAGPDTVFLESF